MASRTSIDAFLTARRIAVVGVSREPRSFTNSVYRHLRAGDRDVVPVNPFASTLEGDRCAASVIDIEDPLDGVLVMVDALEAPDVVRDCITRGVPRVWLHRGAGQGAVSAEAVEMCRSAGIDVVDGACPMMFAEPVGVIHRLHRLVSGRRVAA
ncbi:MAG: CoA-binding protein [Acidimicrobiales bacterium]